MDAVSKQQISLAASPSSSPIDIRTARGRG